jgi:Rrf2 family transcriptional regulator, cysteine metabolism repressor
VTVGDVLRAVEGSVNGFEPVRRGRGRVARDPAADLSELWREIDEAVSGVIDRVTFEDLRKRAEERRSVARPMYHI